MSHETDSFIDEVTEEVRRDRLFAALRRYGWIGVLVVVLIVGGAAWNEWRKAQAEAAARQLGDEILTALQSATPDAAATALRQIHTEGEAAQVVELLLASDELAASDPAAAVAALEPLAASTAVPPLYSDIAAFKLVLMGDDGVDLETRGQLLDRLSQPGAPFRNLALEQQAIALAAAGDTAAAVAAARALLQEPALTAGMVRRVSQLIVALGADIAEEAG